MRTPLILYLCLLFALMSVTVSGQNGACCRAAYFDVDTAPEPPIFAGIGNTHWPIHTASDSCQLYFDQGIRQNHCFNDFEAIRAFRKALRFDPDCAMCYWGWAVTITNQDVDLKGIKDMIDKATTINERYKDDSLYDYQRVIIDASAKWLLDKNEKRGTKQYHKALLTMPARHQNNIEYLFLLSQSIGDGYDAFGKPLKGQEECLSYLRRAFTIAPTDFAVNHYWIHAVEGGIYIDSARRTAELLPTLAPGSPHIIHMPGHIYFRLGEYLRADSAFKKAFVADSAYMSRYHISSYNDWNYIHNLDFMVATMAEMGRVQEGLYWQKKLDAVPVLEACRNSGKNANGYDHYFGCIDIPLRAHEWRLAEYGSAALRQRFDTMGAMTKHPLFAPLLTFYEMYAQFAALRDLGKYEDAHTMCVNLQSHYAKYLHLKSYRKDDYYGMISSGADIYMSDIQAFCKEMDGSDKKAEKILDNAIYRERWVMQSEPPSTYSSAFEWKIDFLIRQHRYDDAVKLADDYCMFRKNSPFSAYYKALAAEKAGAADTKELYQKALSLFGPDDLAIKRTISAKAK